MGCRRVDGIMTRPKMAYTMKCEIETVLTSVRLAAERAVESGTMGTSTIRD